MAKVIIKVDNDIVANSLAIWFESGDAIRAWYDNQEEIIEQLIEDGETIPEIDPYPSVEFGDPDDWEMAHTVSLYEK